MCICLPVCVRACVRACAGVGVGVGGFGRGWLAGWLGVGVSWSFGALPGTGRDGAAVSGALPPPLRIMPGGRRPTS